MSLQTLLAKKKAAITMMPPPSLAPPAGYELIFEDNFDYVGPPDPTKWINEGTFWLNDPSYATVDGTKLILRATATGPADEQRAYSSIRSSDSEYFHVARTQSTGFNRMLPSPGWIEVRMKPADVQGVLSGIIVWGTFVPFPTSATRHIGELDILEARGFQPTIYNVATHARIFSEDYVDPGSLHPQQSFPVVEAGQYHTFVGWFREDAVEVYIDGTLVHSRDLTNDSYPNWGEPQGLVLETYVGQPGDGWAGHGGVTYPIDAETHVEYVRFYTLQPPPTAVADTLDIGQNTIREIVDVLANDVNATYGVVTIEGSVTGNATAIVLADNTIEVARSNTSAGSYSLTYRVTTPFGFAEETLSGTIEAFVQVPIGGPVMAHPINSGLVFFVGGHPTGSPHLGKEMISGNTIAPGSGNFNRNWAVPVIGQTWKVFDHPGGTTTVTPASMTPGSGLTGITGDCTIHIRFLVDAWVADWIDLLEFRGSGEYEFLLERQGSTNTTLVAVRAGGTPTFVNYGLGTGGERSLGLVRNSGATDGCTTYENGAPSIDLTLASDIDWDEVTSVLLGGSLNGGANWCSDGAIMQIRVWDRALSDAEMAELHTNPAVGLSIEEFP